MLNTILINGREYEWADISIVIGGIPLTGFRKINYKKSIEKEVMYAKGRKGHSIQWGNEAVTGSITLTQSQLEMLNRASFGDILRVKFDVVVSYGAEIGRISRDIAPKITTDTLLGCEFTEFEKGMSQGDKNMEIELPLIALDLLTT